MAKILIVLLVGVFGGMLVTNFFNIQITPKSAPAPIVTPPVKEIVELPEELDAPPPTAIPSVAKTTAKGSIDIELGYPADGIPPLKVCLFAVPAKAGEYAKAAYCETTTTNQTEMTLSFNPGVYHIFAWPAGTQNSTLVGSWTPAVACGLSVDCKDHSPLAITITSDKITSGVEIKDWYGDGSGYPKQP